jgi:putative PIN family toxin of toxin-antitoxin system
MRAVLDTNIFISGIHWTGASGKIIEFWLDGKFELVVSAEIIDEIVKTLANFRVSLDFEEILSWASIISEKSVFVEPLIKFNAVKEDLDDNKFVDVAVQGGADFIVSQDNHLLKIGEFKDIKILKPEEFLVVLEMYGF